MKQELIKSLTKLREDMFDQDAGDGFQRADDWQIEMIADLIEQEVPKSREWVLDHAQEILSATPTVGPMFGNRIDEMKKEWLAWQPKKEP